MCSQRQCSKLAESMDTAARSPRVQFWFHHLLAVCPWENYLSFNASISLLKIRNDKKIMIIPIRLLWRLKELRYIKFSEQCLAQNTAAFSTIISSLLGALWATYILVENVFHLIKLQNMGRTISFVCLNFLCIFCYFPIIIFYSLLVHTPLFSIFCLSRVHSS